MQESNGRTRLAVEKPWQALLVQRDVGGGGASGVTTRGSHVLGGNRGTSVQNICLQAGERVILVFVYVWTGFNAKEYNGQRLGCVSRWESKGITMEL